ncbi:hypothetical protein L211DRAFT_232166, partial [Terfezia boudieri ATCC MYA-4762]
AWIKLDQYHAQTASSQVIATILDPQYKLQTFRNLSWQEEWITEAQTSFIQTYIDQYAPTSSDSNHPNTPDPFENDSLDDDLFLQYLDLNHPLHPLMHHQKLKYI